MGWTGPMTHRQCLEWIDYLDWERNRAEPIHYYLMQIAAEVQDCIPAAFSQGYSRTDAEKKRIRFTQRVIRQLTPEEQALEAHDVSMQYAGMFGFSPEIIASLKPGESIQLGKGSLARRLAEIKGEPIPEEKPDHQLIKRPHVSRLVPNPRPNQATPQENR